MPQKLSSPTQRFAGLFQQYIDLQRARSQGDAPVTLPLLSIETTTACNATCGMCSYPTHYPLSRPPLSTEALCGIIDQAAELGTRLISLGGGEPFMRPDAEILIDRITHHGMTALLHTNGSFLTDERIRRLSHQKNLVVSLSLDSPYRAEHDSLRGVRCFDKVIAASIALSHKKSKARVTWLCTVTRQNLHRLGELIALAHTLGVRTVRFTLVHENLQHRQKSAHLFDEFRLDANHAPLLRAQVEQIIALSKRFRITTNSRAYLRALPDAITARVPHRCYAGFLFAVIDPSGQLMPCYDHGPGLWVGPDQSLAEAWQAPAMNTLRQRVIDCQQACWNIGTAEPSLRVTPANLPTHAAQLAREALFFLK